MAVTAPLRPPVARRRRLIPSCEHRTLKVPKVHPTSLAISAARCNGLPFLDAVVARRRAYAPQPTTCGASSNQCSNVHNDRNGSYRDRRAANAAADQRRAPAVRIAARTCRGRATRGLGRAGCPPACGRPARIARCRPWRCGLIAADFADHSSNRVDDSLKGRAVDLNQ